MGARASLDGLINGGRPPGGFDLCSARHSTLLPQGFDFQIECARAGSIGDGMVTEITVNSELVRSYCGSKLR